MTNELMDVKQLSIATRYIGCLGLNYKGGKPAWLHPRPRLFLPGVDQDTRATRIVGSLCSLVCLLAVFIYVFFFFSQSLDFLWNSRKLRGVKASNIVSNKAMTSKMLYIYFERSQAVQWAQASKDATPRMISK